MNHNIIEIDGKKYKQTFELVEKEAKKKPLTGYKFFVDIGHGYHGVDVFDKGAMSSKTGVVEFNQNKVCAFEIDKLLREQGARVILHNSYQLTFDLSDRIRRAEKANCDFIISVHHNAYIDPSVQGTETLYKYHPNFATYVNDAMCQQLGFRNRGVKKRSLTMLSSKDIPSVLIEPYFVGGDGIAKENADEYSKKAAVGVVNGVLWYVEKYGVK